LTNVSRKLKTLAESALKVHILRRANTGWSEFTAEYHHHFYAYPWYFGRDIFDCLISRGLQLNHKLLDFGCGSLRAGIWLISYLDEMHYFGTDAHLKSLKAAVHYEIPLHDLEPKQPRFLHSSTFEINHFGETFDMVLASYVFPHLTEAQVDLALRKITANLAPCGKLILCDRLPAGEDTLRKRYGLELVHKETRESKLGDIKTEWFELQTMSTSLNRS
jgi:ubiquinone/menaquinone biosynthesis C-methylase UbiE